MTQEVFLAAQKAVQSSLTRDDVLGLECLKLLQKYQREPWIDYGRTRAVFRRNSYVVKVPLSEFGVLDNDTEARRYKRYPDIYARCRLAGLLLIMEYVEYVGWQKDQPAWTSSIDCGQVGYNRKGKLVAYDYGFG